MTAMVKDSMETSMTEAWKMLAIWMISLRTSLVLARTLMSTSSRRMENSGGQPLDRVDGVQLAQLIAQERRPVLIGDTSMVCGNGGL